MGAVVSKQLFFVFHMQKVCMLLNEAHLNMVRIPQVGESFTVFRNTKYKFGKYHSSWSMGDIVSKQVVFFLLLNEAHLNLVQIPQVGELF